MALWRYVVTSLGNRVFRMGPHSHHIRAVYIYVLVCVCVYTVLYLHYCIIRRLYSFSFAYDAVDTFVKGQSVYCTHT